MDYKQMALGGMLGVLGAGIPIWVFFESRVEKRVRQEVRVAELQKDHEGMEKDLEGLEVELEGFTWTMERRVNELEKGMAVEHVKGGHE